MLVFQVTIAADDITAVVVTDVTTGDTAAVVDVTQGIVGTMAVNGVVVTDARTRDTAAVVDTT